MRHSDMPLSEALRLIATMNAVKESEHRATLRAAADVVDAALPHKPRVILTGTPTADPTVTAVAELLDDLARVRDEVAVMADRLEDVQRMVRKVFWHEHNEQGEPSEATA